MILESHAVGLSHAWKLADRIKSAWRAGEPLDAAAALAKHPTLAAHRSVVIDLAFNEFWLREIHGDAPDPERFVERFPGFEESVRDMLDAHFLFANPADVLPPIAQSWPDVGTPFEGLELRAELGRGAFGRAYLAFDPAINRLRVLKLATGGRDEPRLIGQLCHPHVVDICWARTLETHQTAVCMPFVGATTLADALAELRPGAKTAQPLLDAARQGAIEYGADARFTSAPIAKPGDSLLVAACAIGARIAEAVDYIHRKKVVHGDLKPSNVVLDGGGWPRLIDFNLAAGDESPTALRGTPAYMAPEQLEAALAGRTSRGIDGARADLYSLGALLAELLTGKRPFGSVESGKLAAALAVIHTSPPRLSPALPRSIARILAQCLAPHPENRPASAAVVAAALDRYVAGERAPQRSPRPVAAAFTVAAAVLAIGFTAAIRPDARPTLPAVASDSQLPAAPDPFEDGLRLLHDGKVYEAKSAFQFAHDRTHDPRALALESYCYAANGQHEIAVHYGLMAVEQGGGSPELENNIGCSLARLARFQEAIAHLDRAVEAAPRFQAALFNRGRIRWQAELKAGKPTDPAALSDIRAALALGLDSAELHLTAARIIAFHSRTDLALRDIALDHLDRAIDRGQNPATWKKDVILNDALGGSPRFAAICRRTPPTGVAASKQAQFVEPSYGGDRKMASLTSHR